MLDVFTIGHTTLDTFVKIPRAHLRCQLNRSRCELCLNYGDKIVVERIESVMGGNAANSAVGLQKLGFETGILTYLGDDREGNKIMGELKKRKIKRNWVVQSAEGKTDQSVVLTFQGERTILADHYPWAYQFPADFPQTKWIYLTSINKNFFSFHREFLAWYQSVKGVVPLVAFNPGSHELKAGVSGNADILRVCQLLILNRQEAENWLRSLHPTAVPREREGLLTALGKLGPKVVVITDAENGSFAYDGQNFYSQGAYPAQPVEMTGAGDAFSAGFLGGLLDGQDPAMALKWGNALAGSVIGRLGAINGLLTRKELLGIIGVL